MKLITWQKERYNPNRSVNFLFISNQFSDLQYLSSNFLESPLTSYTSDVVEPYFW